MLGCIEVLGSIFLVSSKISPFVVSYIIGFERLTDPLVEGMAEADLWLGCVLSGLSKKLIN